MSSFMRTVERQKVRSQIEKNEGRHNVSKKLKAWYDEYRKKRKEYNDRRKYNEKINREATR